MSLTYQNYQNFYRIQDGHFRGCSRWGEVQQKCPILLKICRTYPAMIKLGIVIPYLKKIQKNMNHVTLPLSSADISIFFTETQQSLLYQEIQI